MSLIIDYTAAEELHVSTKSAGARAISFFASIVMGKGEDAEEMIKVENQALRNSEALTALDLPVFALASRILPEFVNTERDIERSETESELTICELVALYDPLRVEPGSALIGLHVLIGHPLGTQFRLSQVKLAL